MHDASQIFKKHLEDCAFNFSGRFSESSFIPNVNGEISQFKNWSKETMVDSLVRQFASSVLWQQSVEKAIEAGASSANEFGAGKVLSGLLRRINFNQKQIDGCQFGEVGDFK